uniref:Uncharacterized protein n=1 Tax=Micrurus surinamensis TaxID=129470 RepID=A0A2D4PFV8_MICSU
MQRLHLLCSKEKVPFAPEKKVGDVVFALLDGGWEQLLHGIPEEDVDLWEPFPLLPALWTLIPLGRRPPQCQAVPTEAVPAVQGGGVDEDVVAAVARELADRDPPADPWSVQPLCWPRKTGLLHVLSPWLPHILQP